MGFKEKLKAMWKKKRAEDKELEKMRREIYEEERKRIYKKKFREEARKKAEREAYGFLTPSRKAAIVKLVKKGIEKGKGKKKTQSVRGKQHGGMIIVVSEEGHAKSKERRWDPEQLLR
jgi:hypothetical protein